MGGTVDVGEVATRDVGVLATHLTEFMKPYLGGALVHLRLRDQLKLRPRNNIRMGVIAMDGVYRMRDRLVSGSDHEAIARMLRKALERPSQT
jgi:hypothetical protein